MARVKNVSKDVFIDRFAGKEYKIPPGKSLVVPDAAVLLWLGDGTPSDASRAAYRRGGRPPQIEVEADGKAQTG